MPTTTMYTVGPNARVLNAIQTMTNFAAFSGAPIATVKGLAPGMPDVIATYTLDGTDSLTYAIPATDPTCASTTPRRIVRVTRFDPQGGFQFEEWRVAAETRRRRGNKRGVREVRCSPILLDLVDCGPIRDLTSATPNYSGSMNGATLQQFWDAWVMPMLTRVGYTHIKQLGTVDFPTQTYDWVWDHETPLAVLRRTLSTGKNACELSLTQIPTGTFALYYQFNAVAQINGSLSALAIGRGNLLRDGSLSYDVTDMLTRLSVSGANGTTIDRNALSILASAAVTGGNTNVSTFDPAGRVALAGSANQWVGRALRRVRTGRTFAIYQSVAFDNNLWLTGAPATPFAYQEPVELVDTAGDDTVRDYNRRVLAPAAFACTSPVGFQKGRGLDFTLSAPDASGWSTLTLDTAYLHQKRDWGTTITGTFGNSIDDPLMMPLECRAEIWRQALAATYAEDQDGTDGVQDYTNIVFLSQDTVAGTKTYKLSRTQQTGGGAVTTADRAIAGLAVGQILSFKTTDNDVQCAEVTAISGAQFTVKAHLGAWVPTWAGNWTGSMLIRAVRAWSYTGIYDLAVQLDTAANKVRWNSGAGILANDRVIFVEPPPAAKYLDEMKDPNAEAAYGVRAGMLKAEQFVGVRNMTGNGYFRAWTSGAPAPDGFYIASGTNPTRYQRASSTDPKLHKKVDQAMKWTNAAAPTTAVQGTVASAGVPMLPRVANEQVSVKVWFFLEGTPYDGAALATPASVKIRVLDVTRKADGSMGAVIGTYQTPLGTGSNAPVHNTLASAVLNNVTIPATCRRIQLLVDMDTGSGVGMTRSVYLCGIMLATSATAPDELIDWSGSNDLIGASAAALAARSSPETTTATGTLAVRDLEREEVFVYTARKIVVGRFFTYTEADSSGVGQTLRIRRVRQYLNRPDRTEIDAAQLAGTLSSDIASALSTG